MIKKLILLSIFSVLSISCMDLGHTITSDQEKTFRVLAELIDQNDIKNLEKLLIETNFDLNYKDKATGFTLVHLAAFARNPQIADYILQKGANPNERSNLLITPIMIAGLNKDIELVRILLEWGAKYHFDQESIQEGEDTLGVINLLKTSGEEIRNKLEEYEFLIDNGNQWAKLPYWAIIVPNELTIQHTIESIFAEGTDLAKQIAYANLRDYKLNINELLKKATVFQVNVKSGNIGTTPIMWAVANKNQEIVKALLDFKPTRSKCYAPVAFIQYLLGKKTRLIDLELTNQYNETAFTMARKHYDENIFGQLITYINPEVTQIQKSTKFARALCLLIASYIFG